MNNIYNPATDPEPEKRKFIYVMSPVAYEIAGCPKCGKNNITWSEYVKHCWCYDCKIDYVPEHGGIFDGPIPIGLSGIFGISFDRVEIGTDKVTVAFIDNKPNPEWDKCWP